MGKESCWRDVLVPEQAEGGVDLSTGSWKVWAQMLGGKGSAVRRPLKEPEHFHLSSKCWRCGHPLRGGHVEMCKKLLLLAAESRLTAPGASF